MMQLEDPGEADPKVFKLLKGQENESDLEQPGPQPPSEYT